jgi:hypothetical protein
MTRSVMASRLPSEVRVAGRRVAADVVCGVRADFDDVDLVETDLVDAVLEESLDLRPFVLVLKGLAIGARLMVPSAFAAGFAGGCFLDASVVASEVALPEIARRSSAVARRWNSIYCTPMGFALFGWVEVSEMTGAGSFVWGPG